MCNFKYSVDNILDLNIGVNDKTKQKKKIRKGKNKVIIYYKEPFLHQYYNTTNLILKRLTESFLQWGNIRTSYMFMLKMSGISEMWKVPVIRVKQTVLVVKIDWKEKGEILKMEAQFEDWKILLSILLVINCKKKEGYFSNIIKDALKIS